MITPDLVAIMGNNLGTLGAGRGFIPVNVDANGNLMVTAATGGGGGSINTVIQGFDGTTNEIFRVANVYKTVLATAAGSTLVWTATAGKSFRVMGYTLSIAGTLAAAGVLNIQLLDNATPFVNHNAAVGNALSGDTQIGADLGQGYLQQNAGNLNVNLSAAMVSGSVAVNVWGTQE